MAFQNTYRSQYLTVNIAHTTCGKVVGPFGQQLSPELLQLQRSKNMDMKGWQLTECKVHTQKKGQHEKLTQYTTLASLLLRMIWHTTTIVRRAWTEEK